MASRKKVYKEERWKKEKVLGRGGFGVVTLEKCIQGDSKDRLRAVKKIRKADNYERELEAIALFSHEKYAHCFVKSFGWYDDEDDIYITMEYFEKGDLQKHLQSPLAEIEGQCIVSQVLEGLSYMHRHGFAHRDLKPTNILVVSKKPGWWVKIADFGISKRAIEKVTALHTSAGTSAFAAPEVQLGSQSSTEANSYTNSVDIWSLGVIAFLILTGETLFKDLRRLSQYVAGTFPFPDDTLLAYNITKEACIFIHNLLAARPEDRPTAEDCLQSLWLASVRESTTLQTQR
ncbi:kinase-like domain-containing protein [Rutstroemia sp. NJR-2017a BVV2]|nr:kinase-like domain-containing protein [Rutstroemia sp. NJR-2017a BVV2]